MTTSKKQILKAMAKNMDMMKGSLAESSRHCGQPSCKKCQQGQFHHGYFFSFRIKGKQKMFYVPKKYYSSVKKLNDNWKNYKNFIENLTDINVQLIRKGKFDDKKDS